MNDIPSGIPVAPEWSLWAGEAGKGFILAALILMIAAVGLWAVQPRLSGAERPAKLAFNLGALCFFGAFASLALLFIKDQFQYEYVFMHGDASTDLKYKISGIWNAQEGSFLLWACTSALFGLLTVRGTGPLRRCYTIVYSTFLGCLAAILAWETPFNVLHGAIAHGKTFVIPNGQGMTPSLQNYWDVIHPPTIFTGFGSLAVFFAYAVAALFAKDASDWVTRARPWVLVSTGILGLGICMGGLWAYETLGWGGFWAWDPVEIASFIPWLFVVILAHGLLVQVSKRKWTFANLFLGGMPFIAFLYGTFLTRSGLLDGVSNHSFAEMDQNARIVLRWFLILVTIFFVALWAIRGPKTAASLAKPEAESPGATREGFYRFGMMLISMLAVVITLGMSWPVITALRGGKGSAIEEWLYHLVVVWFFLPIMLLMAIAPWVSWRSIGWRELGARLVNVVCISIGLTGFVQMGLMSPTFGVHATAGETVAAPFGFRASLPFWMLLLIFTCVFVAVSNIWRIVELVPRSPMGIGGFVAHVGIAVLLGGLIVSRGYEQKEQIFVRQGSPAEALGYIVTYKGTTELDPFDRNGKVFFDVQSPDGSHFEASPGYYQYGPPDEPKPMVWPFIRRSASHDMYLSMSPPEYTAWQQPVTLLPGETKAVNGTTIEYVKPTRKGTPGTMGVTFGAVVKLTTQDSDGNVHVYSANPDVQLSDQGLTPSLPKIGPDYRIAMIGGMNAADRSVQLMLFFSPPIYPITLFYKPLTGLVWLGAILMTGGGLMSAWSRRRVTARAAKAVKGAKQMIEPATSPA
jgi:cytochrome c-type biogenesis protein CcmF